MAEVISEPIPTENPSNTEKIEIVETVAAEKREREEDEENVNEISKKPKVDGDDESTKEKDEEMKEKEEENRNEMLKKPKVDDNDEDEEANKKDEAMKEKEEESEKLGPKEDDEVEETKEKNEEMKEKEKEEESAKLGPKKFESGEAMFNYFLKLLRHWPPNVDINKYEYMVLLDLLKKGHAEADKKIGSGIKAFQVRNHPMWKSRCFFLVRVDGSSDDFSFRKCVDHILPLPENMKIPSSSSGKSKFDGRKYGGHQRGGDSGGRGRGSGHGHGRKARV